MGTNVLAPEWALGKAWSDYRSVSMLAKRFERFSGDEGVPWSRTHTHFANMGGFAIRFTESTPQLEKKVDLSSTSLNPEIDVEHRQNIDTNTSRKDFGAINEFHETNLSNGPEEAMTRSPDSVTDVSKSVPAQTSHKLLVRASHESMRAVMNISRPTSVKAPSSLHTDTDEERGRALNRKVPSGLYGYFWRSLWRGLSSGESMEELIQALSESIGQIPWGPNASNASLVEEAVQLFDSMNFKKGEEVNRFLNVNTRLLHNLYSLQGDLWVLDGLQLSIARTIGIIETLPRITEDEIEDRNKGDTLVKFLALVQVSWFFVQVVTRLCYRIPTSQLEIMVFSFAICAALTYCLLLNKPKDACTSIVINAARHPKAQELLLIAQGGPATWGGFRRDVWIPNNAIHGNPEDPVNPMTEVAQGSLLALVIFGAVHCAAWDFEFLTEVEKDLWRVCSLATIAAIPLGLVLRGITEGMWRLFNNNKRQPIMLQKINGVLTMAVIIIFVICRLFIIVEVFRTLAALPDGAFRSTWSGELPHFG